MVRGLLSLGVHEHLIGFLSGFSPYNVFSPCGVGLMGNVI